jgi:hypothetical protein
MTRLPKFRASLAVVTIALLLAGCSTLPTEPTTQDSSTRPFGGDGTSQPLAGAASEPDPGPGTTGGDGAGTPTGGGGENGAIQSKAVSRLLGGVVRAGRFKVIVPPLALPRNAVITVHQPDLAVNEVQLEISPPSANNFLLPVLLVADCSDMPKKLLSLQAIWWLNPATHRWELVLTTKVDLLRSTVTAALNHFSRYKVDGKAGW